MALDRPDVLVVGGGPVGLAAALALASHANIRVVEAGPEGVPPAVDAAMDHRVYALSPATRQLLDTLGVWKRLPAERIAPVQAMQIFGDRPGSELTFDARQPLAWIVEHGTLVAALWSAVREADLPVSLQSKPIRVELPSRAGARTSLDTDRGESYSAHLIVGADGANSWLRANAQLPVQRKSYDSVGVVANFACEYSHQDIARQWFTRDAVLAWLPLPGKRVSMVWSVAAAREADLLGLAPTELAAAVQTAGGACLGQLQLISPVAAFPLRRILASSTVEEGLVLIGDAAHAIHPLAGQGVNLGFGDVAALQSTLEGRGPLMAAGSRVLLRRYERARREQVAALALLTDQLKQLFERDGDWVARLRNGGLGWLDHQDLLKHAMMRTAMR